MSKTSKTSKLRKALNILATSCTAILDDEQNATHICIPADKFGKLFGQMVALEQDAADMYNIAYKEQSRKDATEILRQHYNENEPDRMLSDVSAAWITLCED